MNQKSKKNFTKNVLDTDDIISSLLDDVDFNGTFDEDKSSNKNNHKLTFNEDNTSTNQESASVEELLENTIYDEIDLLVDEPQKNEIKKTNSESENLVVKNEGVDFWEQAEKMTDQSKGLTGVFEKHKVVEAEKEKNEKFNGPSASDDFLDQIQFVSQDPVHASGKLDLSSSHSNKQNNTNDFFNQIKDEPIQFDNDKQNNIKYNDHEKSVYDQESPPEYINTHDKIQIDLNNKNNFSELNTHQTTEVLSNNDFLQNFDSEKNDNEEKTIPLSSDRTVPFNVQSQAGSVNLQNEKTIAVTQFALNQKNQNKDNYSDEKILLSTQKSSKNNNSQISIDASLAQAENLRIAQNRILELEKEVERLRQENDEILTASEIIRTKTEESTLKISKIEKENYELKSEYEAEISLLKGNLLFKDNEINRLTTKIEEQDLRIKNDFKKIRVRERELENRLELLKAEKQALSKAKDDMILDIQRKLDISKSEIESYRSKIQDLNKAIDSYQNQIKMTMRAMRVALSHVEDNEENRTVPLKKAT